MMATSTCCRNKIHVWRVGPGSKNESNEATPFVSSWVIVLCSEVHTYCAQKARHSQSRHLHKSGNSIRESTQTVCEEVSICWRNFQKRNLFDKLIEVRKYFAVQLVFLGEGKTRLPKKIERIAWSNTAPTLCGSQAPSVLHHQQPRLAPFRPLRGHGPAEI